ncbi:hypothetical protein [Mycolicibacterium sp. CR10]|uniref:hypothetical protein n=1 Tax=Mycolicibacterium sp. CR10 TaxID=2562314 RepID=UPI0010C15397|nr:hypothetical protein [Mycolicibacterium sp. CR10]
MPVPPATDRPAPPSFPPAPQSRSITIPGGGKLTATADLPAMMPDQCAVSFNLMLQLGPFLGATECLVNVLNLLESIVGFAKAAPDVYGMADKAIEVGERFGPVLECITAWSPVGICSFVKDVLTMIADALECVLELLDSVVGQQIELGIKLADAEDNPELAETLQTALDNTRQLSEHGMSSLGPIFSLLGAMGGFLSMLSLPALELPSLDDLTGGDLSAALQPLHDLLDTLRLLIGMCPC